MFADCAEVRQICPFWPLVSVTIFAVSHRMLIFSPHEITKAWVYIDDVHLGEAYHIKGPLYVLPWNPMKYTAGIHYIKINVEVGDLFKDFSSTFLLLAFSMKFLICYYILTIKIHV